MNISSRSPTSPATTKIGSSTKICTQAARVPPTAWASLSIKAMNRPRQRGTSRSLRKNTGSNNGDHAVFRRNISVSREWSGSVQKRVGTRLTSEFQLFGPHSKVSASNTTSSTSSKMMRWLLLAHRVKPILSLRVPIDA